MNLWRALDYDKTCRKSFQLLERFFLQILDDFGTKT